MENFALQNKIKPEVEIADVNEDSKNEEDTQLGNKLYLQNHVDLKNGGTFNNNADEDQESDDASFSDDLNIADSHSKSILQQVTKNNTKSLEIRTPMPVKCKCRFKCADNFPCDRRENICKKYWRIENNDKKNDFIIQRIKFDEKAEMDRQLLQSANEKIKNRSIKYFFFKNGNFVPVCGTFFITTLSINHGRVTSAIKRAMNLKTCAEETEFDGELEEIDIGKYNIPVNDDVCRDEELFSDDASSCDDMSICSNKSDNRDPNSLWQNMMKETGESTKTLRTPKPVDCSKCLYKCDNKFSYRQRENICKNYWKIEDADKKTDYIIQRIKVGESKNKKVREARKNRALTYYFFKNRTLVRVCCKFFHKTLSITDLPIIKAFDKIETLSKKNRSFSSAIKGVNSGILLEPKVDIKLNQENQQKHLDNNNVCGDEIQNKFDKNLRVRVCRNFKTLSIKDVPIKSAIEGVKAETNLEGTEVDIRWDQHDQLYIDNGDCGGDEELLSDDASSCDESKSNNRDFDSLLARVRRKKIKESKKTPKTPKPVNCKCRHLKCSENFPQHKRENICKNFWKIKSFDERVNFIAERIQFDEKKIQSENQSGRRKVRYFFFKNRTFVGVCRSFFLSTLSICTGPLEKAIRRVNPVICHLGESET